MKLNKMIFVSLRNTSNFSQTSRQIECFVYPWYIFNLGNSPGTTFRKRKSLQKTYYCRDETNILSVASKRFSQDFGCFSLNRTQSYHPAPPPPGVLIGPVIFQKAENDSVGGFQDGSGLQDEEPGVKLKAKETEIHTSLLVNYFG